MHLMELKCHCLKEIKYEHIRKRNCQQFPDLSTNVSSQQFANLGTQIHLIFKLNIV